MTALQKPLHVTGLCKTFAGAPVLLGVDLAVEAGSLVAVLGASGSGKTTLLRLIAGFERPDAGAIMLGGVVLAGPGVFVPPERRGVGYVSQEGALFPHLSVADNISFGLPRAARRARLGVVELLGLVGLSAGYAGRAPQELSGGEQQRVALARALAPMPGLVLLDEPFSALDAGLREETRLAVAAALRQAGATAILVTHDQAEALSMGAFVGVLRQGVLRQMSTPQDLYRHPGDAALADFVGDAVFCDGVARGASVDCALGRLRLAMPADGAVKVMVRPEQIKLAAAGVSAFVNAVVFYGHDAVLDLAVCGGPRVTARVFSQAVPSAGARVLLAVEGEVVAYPAV